MAMVVTMMMRMVVVMSKYPVIGVAGIEESMMRMMMATMRVVVVAVVTQPIARVQQV